VAPPEKGNQHRKKDLHFSGANDRHALLLFSIGSTVLFIREKNNGACNKNG